MPGTAHDTMDAVKLVIIAVAAVFIIVIALAFIFQYEHISFIGFDIIYSIASVPQAIFNFISNVIYAISTFVTGAISHL